MSNVETVVSDTLGVAFGKLWAEGVLSDQQVLAILNAIEEAADTHSQSNPSGASFVLAVTDGVREGFRKSGLR